MRKAFVIAAVLTAAFTFGSCGNSNEVSDVYETDIGTISLEISAVTTLDTISTSSLDETAQTEENDMFDIRITSENKDFSAKLYNNKSVSALMEQFPVTVKMSELNGNEKYCYLDENIPTNSEKPGKINSGDIMLFGSDCLVIFYDSFSTSYSYTKLGYIENPDDLKDVFGFDDVTVTFQVM